MSNYKFDDEMERKFMEKMKKQYLSTAQQKINNIEKALNDFINNPHNKEKTFEAYRITHSLKGSSASYDFQRLSEVAHEMESILKNIYNGKIQYQESMKNFLFDCLNTIKKLFEYYQKDLNEPEIKIPKFSDYGKK